MNSTAWGGARAAEPSENGRKLFTVVLVTVGCVATAAATIAGNGNIAAALAPTLTALALATMWIVPIRLTLFTLTLLVLAVDAPGDVAGVWHSPFAPLGQLLTYNLDKTVPIDALSIPLMALVLLCAFLIQVHRWLIGSRVDDRRDLAAAPPMLWMLGIALLTVIGLCGEGYLRNGSTQMAKNQVQAFLLLLLMAYLLLMTLRGVRDYRTLGRLIVIAACTKAVLALWVWYTIDQQLTFRTSHGDSILFASATIMLIALVVEQPIKRNAQLCIAILPLLFAGMLANNRRIAWVELAVSVVALALLNPRARFKRAAIRAVVLATPIIVSYGAMGWNSNARVFAPVQLFRSVADADVDRSTLYRDIENYNLLQTLRQHPIAGTGFGQPYLEVVPHDDISGFIEYQYLPHNSILGLWAFGGLIGFTSFSTVMVVSLFLAARRYLRARAPVERAAAFTALATIVVYLIQCWGDVGLSEMRSIFLVGPALAIAGQIGLTRGAIPGHSEQPREN